MANFLDRIIKRVNGTKREETTDKRKQTKRGKILTKAEREEKERKRKEKEILALILEVSFYVVFLILLVSTASNNIDTKAFGYRRSTLSYIDAKNSVDKIRRVDEFWTWMHHSILPFLYPTRAWNNKTLTYSTKLVTTFSSYLIGPLRIRQHRIREGEAMFVHIQKKPCSIEPHFREMDIRCVYSWSSSYMDTRNYSQAWETVIDNKDKEGEAIDQWSSWDYRQWSDIGGTPVMGVFGVYPSGGYVIDITGNLQSANKTLTFLESSDWIDSMTRFVSVEFSLFCPGANLFAMVPVVFEFTQAEIMMGKAHLYPFRLFSYLGGYPSAQLACDFLVYLAIVWFVTREVCKIVKERLKYFTQFWNILELVNLFLSIAAITLYIGRHIITTYVSKDIGNAEGQYYNFQTLAMWNELFCILLGFVCFLSTLQLLHLLRFNRRMSLLAATLKEAANDLSAFSLVFFIVFLAFVSLSYITFGSNLIRYSSVIRSIETLVTVALGKFDYYALTYVNHTLAPIFLFAYMMFIVFILINMLITILNDAFAVVRDDVFKQPNDYELVDYILKRVTIFLWTFNPVRIVWRRAKGAGIVNTEVPNITKKSSSEKEKAIAATSKRQHGNAELDHRPRNRHRPTFNTDFIRLHNRLDNIGYFVDTLTDTLQTETSGMYKFHKRHVSFLASPFNDCDFLSLSLDESGSSCNNEQVVPGNRKGRPASHLVDRVEHVVPQFELRPDSNSEKSLVVDADPTNLNSLLKSDDKRLNGIENDGENGADLDDQMDRIVPHFVVKTIDESSHNTDFYGDPYLIDSDGESMDKNVNPSPKNISTRVQKVTSKSSEDNLQSPNSSSVVIVSDYDQNGGEDSYALQRIETPSDKNKEQRFEKGAQDRLHSTNGHVMINIEDDFESSL